MFELELELEDGVASEKVSILPDEVEDGSDENVNEGEAVLTILS